MFGHFQDALTAFEAANDDIAITLDLSVQSAVEAARAMGASTGQIVWKVLLPEARPALIQSFTVMVVNLIGYSAMAGAIGGGGLGDLEALPAGRPGLDVRRGGERAVARGPVRLSAPRQCEAGATVYELRLTDAGITTVVTDPDILASYRQDRAFDPDAGTPSDSTPGGGNEQAEAAESVADEPAPAPEASVPARSSTPETDPKAAP